MWHTQIQNSKNWIQGLSFNHCALIFSTPKQARPSLPPICTSSYKLFVSLWDKEEVWDRLGEKKSMQAVTSKWKRQWKKSSPALETQRRSQTWAPPKIANSLFSSTWSLFSALSANPTLSYHNTHTRRTREQMNSHRHQWARSVDDTHWMRARAQREDGWLKRSCLPCFPHILITHYSVMSGSGGP